MKLEFETWSRYGVQVVKPASADSVEVLRLMGCKELNARGAELLKYLGHEVVIGGSRQQMNLLGAT